jgi:hypothetical protein
MAARQIKPVMETAIAKIAARALCCVLSEIQHTKIIQIPPLTLGAKTNRLVLIGSTVRRLMMVCIWVSREYFVHVQGTYWEKVGD